MEPIHPLPTRWYNAVVTSGLSPSEWKEFLGHQPETHLLQTVPWGELKASFGWQVERLAYGNSGAQLLFRRLPFGLTLAYIPKGPVGIWLPDLLPKLDEICSQRRAFALKIEPDSAWDPSLAQLLEENQFRYSPHSIQPHRTLIVDLSMEDEAILQRMKQKTRYNIRLASRKDVIVDPWDDLSTFSEMIAETAARDGFGAHSGEYYRKAYDLFRQTGKCELFVARVENVPVAALMVFAFGERAWYFYGASTSAHRERMPTYLLQWEAIRWAKSQGCLSYDLWGVPDFELEELERQFPTRKDDLWGVYRFKRGFGGDLARTMGAWDRPYSKPLYWLYRLALPLIYR